VCVCVFVSASVLVCVCARAEVSLDGCGLGWIMLLRQAGVDFCGLGDGGLS